MHIGGAKKDRVKVKKILAITFRFFYKIQHLQSNLNEFTGYGIHIYKIMV